MNNLKKCFEDEVFWREMYHYKFPEKRFADAAVQIGQVLKLIKPKGKAWMDGS